MRTPLLRRHLLPGNGSGNPDNLDRFIPNRAALDMDYARYMMTAARRGNENGLASPTRSAYQKLLDHTFNMNRGRRIFAFKNKPPSPVDPIPQALLSPPPLPRAKHTKPDRYVTRVLERTLDAEGLVNDFYLNLLDWSVNNVLAIAIENTVHLWNASDRSVVELTTIDDEDGPVTSISWAVDGRHIAVGLNNSDVQLWDSVSLELLRTLRGCHRGRVGALAWNEKVLSTGGMDGRIVNNDVRVRSHVVGTCTGHLAEVCGLKWSPSGQHLASGGNDNLVYIWDRETASSRNSPRQWLHRIQDHKAAVKALAWCPYQQNLLASGGGEGDQCIRFWNADSGTCLSTVETSSQVSGLLWNKNERELLSSHGSNELILWKYPSMVMMAELTGHTSRVLFLTQSPDGCTVASASADQTVRIWNVFGTPGVSKPVREERQMPFAGSYFIR